ncbi:MAG: hypothetical protein P4L49_05500 [Desulfosporosinus sp.]|nr:hypothetical protein [Desulfosporosinus sp.]
MDNLVERQLAQDTMHRIREKSIGRLYRQPMLVMSNNLIQSV